MITASSYAGKRVAVFGLARSGLTAARSLVEGGAEVLAWDDRESAQEAARADGLSVVDLRDADWSGVDSLVLSPGVPDTLPEPHWSAEMAKAAGVPIICDVEIFVREVADSSARIVAITGTNGKSTTTALIQHILERAGVDAHMGGNIGRGVLDLPAPGADTVYVLELSSYQLERCPSLAADVAVWLNLSPDHLDRHGDMAGYEAAKRHIFAGQGAGDVSVVGVDDAVGRRLVTELGARAAQTVVPISSKTVLGRGVAVKDGQVLDALGLGGFSPAIDLSGLDNLRGRHNHQNAAAAYAATRSLGLSADAVGRGLNSFPGLAHRMEFVARIGEVAFVNDSKATNAESAAQALGSFERIYWIAGGLPKAGGIAELAPLFSKVERAYLIGASAGEFARTLETAGVATEMKGDLDVAVRAAARDAADAGGEAVVLLSPACASFDQFASFEARGDVFRATVEELKP